MAASCKAIFIFGPTCSGKTKLGVSLAQILDGEVISVDSLQCYRAGKIMTAAPQHKEMAGVVHHMIDYLEAHEEPHDDHVSRIFGVLDDMYLRQKTPLFVGGSTSLVIQTMQATLLRNYEIYVFTLAPLVFSEAYTTQVKSRIETMLDDGLIDEVAELKRLEDSAPVKHGAARGIGIWKAIGYPELLPYLHCRDGDRDRLLRRGLETLTTNTVQYGAGQVEFMQKQLVPFLQSNSIRFSNLPVSFDEEIFKTQVERHALSIAVDFCHPWSETTEKSTLPSNGSHGAEKKKGCEPHAPSDGSNDSIQSSGSNGYPSPTSLPSPRLVNGSYGSNRPNGCLSPAALPSPHLASGSNRCDSEMQVSSSQFAHASEPSKYDATIESAYTSPVSDSLSPSNESRSKAVHTVSIRSTQYERSTNKATVCIFGGSSAGDSPAHSKAAKDLAQTFHAHGVRVVYGGGATGIMGALARELVRLSGPTAVLGVIPKALAEYEASFSTQDTLIYDPKILGKRVIVRDMHTRKRIMVDKVRAGGPGSGFVALSGGYGTAEELLEQITWKQLGIHDCPVCMLNVEGSYNGLVSWFDQLVAAGFIHKKHASIFDVAANPDEIVETLFRKQPTNDCTLDWS